MPILTTISPAPSPCPAEYLKKLLSEHKLHRMGVAVIVKVDIRTVHRWCSGERAIPWAAAELLRRVLEEGRAAAELLRRVLEEGRP